MRTFTADAAAIRLLRAQHGYGNVAQLHELGLSRGQIAHRVSRGILEREGRGVVSLTPPDHTPAGLAMRAVLLVGAGAVASLWTAAALHRLTAPRSRQTHIVVEGHAGNGSATTSSSTAPGGCHESISRPSERSP